jgi:hypothetical protein
VFAWLLPLPLLGSNVTLFNHEAKPLFFQAGKHTNVIDLGLFQDIKFSGVTSGVTLGVRILIKNKLQNLSVTNIMKNEG